MLLGEITETSFTRLSARICAALLLLAALLAMAPPSTIATAKTPSSTGPTFKLVDQHGRSIDETTLAKRPVVLHFGFTQCPVICPTTMLEVAERMRDLGPLADEMYFVMVTVDPEQDTPEHLKQYLASFDERIIGLSGSASEIKALIDGLGATVVRQARDDGSYTFDHTIFAYLMAPGWTKTGVLYMGTGSRSERVLSMLRAFAAKAERARLGARTD